MRRLGYVLASTLLLGGLAAPAGAASAPAPAPLTLSGPTFVNYGPHVAPRVIPPTTTTPRINARTTAARSTTNPAYNPNGTPNSNSPFTDDSVQCSHRPSTLGSTLPWTNLCVHYQANSTLLGGSANVADPTFVASVVNAFVTAEARYVRSGYKAPEPDPATPGVMNVYLEDLKSWEGGQFKGAFGFTSTASDTGTHGGTDASAFMVLDNNFSCSDYADACNNPYGPTQIMQVTVAHEFFHATQFAYDATEDQWFMESTATWAETQVYPALTDNLNYLYAGPAGVVSLPNAPLDDNTGGQSGGGGLALYQDFLWWQYLGEHVPGRTGQMPSVVLNAWRYSDATWGTPAYFSITAAKHAIERAGLSFGPVWRDFSYANVAPVYAYANGHNYPGSKIAVSKTISPSALGSFTSTRYVPHLASQTMLLRSSSLPANQNVHLAFRVPTPSVSSVTVAVYLRNGGRNVYRLDVRSGYARLNLGIGSGTVGSVAITFANAGVGYTGCGSQDYGYSCHGTSTVAKAAFRWSAAFYRA